MPVVLSDREPFQQKKPPLLQRGVASIFWGPFRARFDCWTNRKLGLLSEQHRSTKLQEHHCRNRRRIRHRNRFRIH
jgi:hypothetical protein